MTIIRKQVRESTSVRNVLEAEKIVLGQTKTDISITGITELKGGKEAPKERSGLVFEVTYKVDYELSQPKGKKLGNIVVVTELFFVDEIKVVKEILSEWKKDKKLSNNVIPSIIRVALEQSMIEAIEQSYKVGLPSPVPLPTVRAKRKDEQDAESS
jgi:hypothetical protein